MGLVDYSDSESDSETVTKPAPPSQPVAASAPAAAASGKKPFQKVVDRAKPGKILVNLPQSSSSRDEIKPSDTSNEPPPKRARVAGRGGGAFSGFNSFLPAPKNVGKPAAAVASSSGTPAPRPGINLKTGATPGFSREVERNEEGGSNEAQTGREDAEPAMKQPSIPAEQKPADEVKLVGKPLMFKPLSVSRKPGKKSATKPKTTTTSTPSTSTPPAPLPSEESKPKDTEKAEPPPKRQKISLFSISDEPDTDPVETHTSNNTGVYEPMFSTPSTNTTVDDFAAYDAQFAASPSAPAPMPSSGSSADTLDAIAADMNLSAAARRELFGRGGEPSGGSRVVRFDTDREYAHNEALRASGQLQPTYNPVRSLAPGKHSLRQLVTQVQSQREALEESFAKGHGNRKEASSKYGWR
ncbi:mitotic checkpoint regulator, MAD2B-interacting-domain-containing protein [Daldinia caldariorum]|uniref:mitotic checkpoint regulator, MAD2B-interacting-domain-containing protein n=1 Tax=Daldinia caldariorum TaxID=326644 RepID=UPI002007CE20|nr:mitotic checkpoint regulator, MAD2B-interacting-domain-containing protein [Daldinia caldariorum]KAI1464643.1 mitotic checkpoint regulator, MAD2B-interacting-domain-containing protein [Daldinia caldariorum]